MFYYPHVAELNTRMMALDERVNTLAQQMERDFEAEKYYARLRMETQQANVAAIYTSNYSIAQCCSNAWMLSTEGWRRLSDQKPKKKLTLEELNRILFPDDPIRDWSERTLAAIEAKYAWLNDYE